ncbi:MAG: S-layer homology domain-containing protein [Tepidanaerobacteraceae bacterium]|nr:S-layer homology domain-containing protein [Tepidanaerobacteraceae bacterium]
MLKRVCAAVLFLALVLSCISGPFSTGAVRAEESGQPKAKVVQTVSDGLRYYVVFELYGKQYRSDEMGPAFNRNVWSLLSDDDKRKVAETFAFSPGSRVDQFGQEGSDAIADWGNEVTGWKAAGEEWENRIAARDYPELTAFYSRSVNDLPVGDKTLYEVKQELQRMAPGSMSAEAYREALELVDRIEKEYAAGLSFYERLKDIRAKQIGNAIKKGSEILIKDIIVDNVMVPVVTSGAKATSDLIAQGIDFINQAVENIKDQASGGASIGDIIQKMNDILDKLEEVAGGVKQQVESDLTSLGPALDRLRQLMGQEQQELNNRVDNKQQQLDEMADQAFQWSQEIVSYPYPPPSEVTEEQQRAEIRSQVISEANSIKGDYEDFLQDIAAQKTDLYEKIGYDDGGSLGSHPGSEKYGAKLYVLPLIEAGSRVIDLSEEALLRPEVLFAYYNYQEAKQAVTSQGPEVVQKWDQAIELMEKYIKEVESFIEETGSGLDEFERRINGLRERYADYVGGDLAAYVFGSWTPEAVKNNLKFMLYEDNFSDTESDYFWLELMNEERERINRNLSRFNEEAQAFEDAIRETLAPYDSLYANLQNSAGYFYGNAVALERLYNQPYFYYPNPIVNRAYLWGELINQQPPDKRDEKIAEIIDELKGIRQQEIDYLRKIELGKRNFAYDLNQLSYLLAEVPTFYSYSNISDILGRKISTPWDFLSENPGIYSEYQKNRQPSDIPSVIDELQSNSEPYYELFFLTEELEAEKNEWLGLSDTDFNARYDEYLAKINQWRQDASGLNYNQQVKAVEQYGKAYGVLLEIGALRQTGGAVPVERIDLVFAGTQTAASSIGLYVGETCRLEALIYPENATDRGVIWTSDNPGIATVNNDGLITAVAEGTAIITAASADGHVQASATVQVFPGGGGSGQPGWVDILVSQPEQGAKIPLSNPVLQVSGSIPGENITAFEARILSYALMGAPGYEGVVVHGVNIGTLQGPDNAFSFTVDLRGLGEAYMIPGEDVGQGYELGLFAWTEGGVQGSHFVTFFLTEDGAGPPPAVPVTGVSLNRPALSLTPGEEVTLVATVTPANATNRRVTWESSNPDVATVDENGKVKAIGAGTATVAVTTADGNKTAACAITVKELQTVTLDAEQKVVAVQADTPVAVAVPQSVTEAKLELAPQAREGKKEATLPRVEAQVELQGGSSLGTVRMQIPSETIVSGPTEWDGNIKLPEVKDRPSVTISQAQRVETVIEVGLPDVALTFDRAVRLVIPGQAGKAVGYIRSGVFTPITRILTEDKQENADSEIPQNGEAFINVGSDLVIWTKHFTEFVVYVPAGGTASYTVAYDGNGATSGTVPVDTNTYEEGATVTVLGNTGGLAKSGYSFAGWNTAADGSGTTYTEGQTFSMGAANVTLYAVWEPVQTALFYEDFESYAENAYPTSFALLYNGTGTANQKVITTSGYDGNSTKVFRLEGASSWASEQLVDLPSPLPETLVIDAYVKPVSGSWPGRIGLYNPNVGSWGTRVSGVLFDSNGKITAVQNGNDSQLLELGTYTMGSWYRITMEHHIAAKTYDVYINGVKVAENIPMSQTVTPTKLNLTAGNTETNEIYYDNVGLYAKSSDEQAVAADKAALTFDVIKGTNSEANNITGDLVLPASGASGTTITWESSDTSVIGNDGKVTRPSYSQGDKHVTLTATVSKGTASDTRTFDLTVKALEQTDAEAVAADKEALTFNVIKGANTAPDNITSDLVLPASGASGTTITWESSDTSVIGNDGKVTRPSYSQGDKHVTLTATISKGAAIDTKTFDLTVKALPFSDTFPPQVRATDPQDNAPNVPVDKTVAIYFDEDVQTGVNIGGITITNQNGSTVDYVYELNGSILTLDPVKVLDHSAVYSVYLPAGAVADLCGNLLGVPYSFTFSTAAEPVYPNPAASSFSPAGENVPVGGEIRVVFDIPVRDSQSVAVELTPAGGRTRTVAGSVYNSTLTVSFTDLLYDTVYLATVPAGSVQSVVYATYNDAITWSFKTVAAPADSQPPEKPKNLRLISRTSSSITLAWDASADNVGVAKYQLEMKRQSTTDFTSAGETADTSYTATGLAPGTAYIFRVRAADAAGNESDWSDELTCATFSSGGGGGGGTVSASQQSSPAMPAVSAPEVRESGQPFFSKKFTPAEAARGVLVESGALTEMMDKKREVHIVSENASLIVTPALAQALLEADATSQVMVSIARPQEVALPVPATLKPAGADVEVTARVRQGQKEADLLGEMHLVLPYDPEKVQNPNRLGIYRWEEGKWRYVGGRADTATLTVSVKLTHLSRYSVFEDTRAFADLAGHWAKNDVELLAARYLVGGLPDGSFAPDRAITRAEFAALLANALTFAGQGEQKEAVKNFTDVPADVWYAGAVKNVAAAGLISGYPDGTFGPEKNISREEAAVMVVRLLQRLQVQVPPAPESVLASYKDAGEAGVWARANLAAAVGSGLLRGSSEERLDPAGRLTRAQAAALLKRVLEKADLL